MLVCCFSLRSWLHIRLQTRWFAVRGFVHISFFIHIHPYIFFYYLLLLLLLDFMLLFFIFVHSLLLFYSNSLFFILLFVKTLQWETFLKGVAIWYLPQFFRTNYEIFFVLCFQFEWYVPVNFALIVDTWRLNNYLHVLS